MIGDMLRHFQFAAVPQVGCDAGDAESMIADLRFDAGGFRAPLDHAIYLAAELDLCSSAVRDGRSAPSAWQESAPICMRTVNQSGDAPKERP